MNAKFRKRHDDLIQEWGEHMRSIARANYINDERIAELLDIRVQTVKRIFSGKYVPSAELAVKMWLLFGRQFPYSLYNDKDNNLGLLEISLESFLKYLIIACDCDVFSSLHPGVKCEYDDNELPF